jgi:membrane protein DedA with SNARE-associated domain
MLQRHPNAAVLSVRFLCGLRATGRIAMDSLSLPRWRMALLDILSAAAIWALWRRPRRN